MLSRSGSSIRWVFISHSFRGIIHGELPITTGASLEPSPPRLQSCQSVEFCRKFSSLGMRVSPVCGDHLFAFERPNRASIHSGRHLLDLRDLEVLEHFRNVGSGLLDKFVELARLFLADKWVRAAIDVTASALSAIGSLVFRVVASCD